VTAGGAVAEGGAASLFLEVCVHTQSLSVLADTLPSLQELMSAGYRKFLLLFKTSWSLESVTAKCHWLRNCEQL